MIPLIVVVEVNGRQSSSVIEALLECPDEWRIRGTCTDPTLIYCQELKERGVEIVKCDINNKEECYQAFLDAYGIFLVNKHWDVADRDEYKQIVNLVQTAKAVNVQHLIASGLPNTRVLNKKQLDMSSSLINRNQMEDYIRRLSEDHTPPYVTFIQIGFYYQNFITFFVPDPTKLEFRYPLLMDSRIPLYDVRDTGKVVRECFRYPEKSGNRQIVPIVAEQLTMEQICTKIKEMTEREINFVPLFYEEALLRLHSETVNNLKLYHEIGSIDEHQAEKTHAIWPKMTLFTDWLRENRWLIE